MPRRRTGGLLCGVDLFKLGRSPGRRIHWRHVPIPIYIPHYSRQEYKGLSVSSAKAQSGEAGLVPSASPSDVFGGTHALVEDTYDRDGVPAHTIDNDVRSNQGSQVRRWQVVSVMAELWIFTNRVQRVIDLVAVGLELIWAPSLTGETQDVDEILMRPR